MLISEGLHLGHTLSVQPLEPFPCGGEGTQSQGVGIQKSNLKSE